MVAAQEFTRSECLASKLWKTALLFQIDPVIKVSDAAFHIASTKVRFGKLSSDNTNSAGLHPVMLCLFCTRALLAYRGHCPLGWAAFSQGALLDPWKRNRLCVEMITRRWHFAHCCLASFAPPEAQSQLLGNGLQRRSERG